MNPFVHDATPQPVTPTPPSTPPTPAAIDLAEVVTMATEALWRNKLRTGLTMLGVVIGIGSVTSITSIGQGIQKNVGQQIQALGTDVLQVMPGSARSGNIFLSMGSLSSLTWEDAKAIANGAPSAQIVSATLQRSAQVVYGSTNTNTTVYGADLNYPAARNTHPVQGRYFTQTELAQAAQVAVLGPRVQQKLFGDQTGLQQNIRIQGEVYRVIGVMESKGSQGPMDRDDTIFIPLTTMSSRIVGNNAIRGVAVNAIWVKGSSQEALTAAQFQISNILRLRHNITNPDKDDFRILNQADLISTFSSVIGIMTVLVVAIAGISLVVGGIGIANIMLVSVVERTREIGIRKALGASSADILKQFLLEAIAISTIGGVIGASGGVAIAFVTAMTVGFPFVVSGWSLIIGFILSMGVGLTAGVIPARNAAQLDPITALRSE